jgi:hypothetical protein
MRFRARFLATLATATSIALLSAGLALAATVAELRDLATGTYQMACGPSGGTITCNRTISRMELWRAYIAPESGEEQLLDTQARVTSAPLMASTSPVVAWMSDMHALACGSPKQVASYVTNVAQLGKPANAPVQIIGTCRFTGSLNANVDGWPYLYVVSSEVLPPPSPTPAVTPPPTPTPEPPQPTTTPKPTATPTPTPSSSPTLLASATPSAAPTIEPSTSTAPPETDPAPTFVPTQGVAAETDIPSASDPPPAAPGPPGPQGPATFPDSVPATTEVSTDGGAIAGSLALALLLLLLIAFAGELFNNTVENNYAHISGWFRKGPLGALHRLRERMTFDPPGRPGVLLSIALTALVSSFVDPGFGVDVRSLAIFLGFLIGLIVVLASFKLPTMLTHWRATGELGRLRPLPWALVIAALFVLVSRIGSFQPGYLYGIVLGAIFIKDVSDKEEGRETFYGSLWTLAAAAVAWLGLEWVRSLGLPEEAFGATLLSTAFAATLVAGLEAAAFGLMPLRFMPGHAVYRWNRLAWALLWGLSVFAFLHILIGPTSGYVAELSPTAFAAALGVFAAFGALSIATWLYFRLRPQPAAAEALADLPADASEPA